MSIVREATISMFEEIHELLRDFENPDIDRDDWYNLFTYSWRPSDTPYGYVLIDKERIVGFLGTVHADRRINGITERFCGLSSWIVKPEYRSESLMLILPVLRNQNVTIINHSPNDVATQVFTKLGFAQLNAKFVIVHPFPSNAKIFFKRKILIHTIKEEIRPHLTPEHQQILDDHRKYKCGHFLARQQDGEYCYIVFSRINRRGLAFVHIHYISNRPFFIANLDEIKINLVKYCRAPLLLIEKRNVADIDVPCGFDFTMKNPRMYRSKSLTPDHIDNLYSELILLNI